MKKFTILLFLFFSFVLSAGTIHAQSDISVSTDTEVRFPTEVTFNLSAENSVDITKIYLRYRLNMITTANVTSVVLLDFIPSASVQTGWIWEMRKMLGSLPPGAEIQYSWRIIDAEGAEHETGWDTVLFNDDNHSWNILTDDNVIVYWYSEDTNFAQTILDASIETLEELTRDMGIHLGESVNLYV